MINTKKVQQKVVSLEDCKYDVDLKNKITQELQNDSIVNYAISPNKLIAYVEVSDDSFGIQIESNDVLFHTDEIYETFLLKFPNVVLETLKTGELSVRPYTDEEMAAINHAIEENEKNNQAIKDDYIVNGKRVPLEDITINNGTVTIFGKDNNILLLQDEYELSYDSDSYDKNDGTVVIIRTDKINKAFEGAVSKEDYRELHALLDTGLNEQIDSAVTHTKESSTIRGTELIEGIMAAFDDIENDRPVMKTDLIGNTGYFKSQQEINTDAMKDILSSLQDVDTANGDSSVTLHTNGDVTISTPTEITINSSELLVEDLSSDEDLKAMTIGDTVTETIQLKVALISFSAFDEYASKHNVVGWNLHSPTTLMIKYMEDGITSAEKVAKFHEMMDNLSPAWIEKTSDNVTFFSELHKVYDRDLVEEFLTRVKKHNVFVRESTAKIRSALLDMEKDFESLKDEINLSIDWNTLTAFAAKKERTEHRINGVTINPGSANIVRVCTIYVNQDFYIPIHLLTDELSEKFSYENTPYFIEDVPNFAFYEVLVNGHVMLIEKTDL